MRLAYMALWGEAWRFRLTDSRPASAHWAEVNGVRRVLRGKLSLERVAASSDQPAAARRGRITVGPFAHLEAGSLRRFFREHYAPRKLRSATDGIRLHETTLNSFEKFLGRAAVIGDLTDNCVSQFLAWMLNRGRSPVTVNDNRNRLLALWRLAARKRLVEEWPDVEPEAEPRRIPRAWSADELRRLFASCRDAKGTICGVAAGQWWLLLHLLIWDTGERIGAVLAIRWDWIDTRGAVLTIPAEFRKGKHEDRRYPLHAETMALLGQVASPRREAVLPWPGVLATIYNRYRKILVRAGLPTGKQFGFHCLRKSVASHGLAMGLDPKHLMGHIDGKVTAKYLDPAIVGQSPGGSSLFRPLALVKGGEA